MAVMICQLIFIVCLLCAKHHLGVIYAFILRRVGGRGERERHLNDMSHSLSRNIKFCVR